MKTMQPASFKSPIQVKVNPAPYDAGKLPNAVVAIAAIMHFPPYVLRAMLAYTGALHGVVVLLQIRQGG